jgi:hypothetical protein
MAMAGEKSGVTGIQVLLLCAVASLSACSNDSNPAPASSGVVHVKPKTQLTAKSGPTAAEQTAGMVQAAGLGKSQLPVELKFDLAGRPKVGQVLEINLALISQISASPATIQVKDSDGLTPSGATQFDIPAEEAGEVYRQTLSVTPKTEGVLLVGVTVSLKHDDLTDQRAFSIPIIAER